MGKFSSVEATVPRGWHIKAILPFALPIIVTFALLILVGDRWPRAIAPGSGLKLAGFGVAVATSYIVWYFTVRGVKDLRVRRFIAIFCGVTGVMGWPVWSTGVLPSINGAVLAEVSSARMTVERTDKTHKSKSRDYYHWAWLEAENGHYSTLSGRYFITEDLYLKLNNNAPPNVDVSFAQGLLGANVVVSID